MDSLDFKFGAEVYGRDKQCGRLAKAVVNPTTEEITDLVVESGRLFKRATLIPVSRVESATDQAIYLTIGSDELNDFPEYRETIIEKAAPAWQPASEGGVQGVPPSPIGIPEMAVVQESVRIGVADGSLVLDNDTPVYGLDGNIGRLSHLIVEAEKFQISQLVVTQGALFPEQLLVPMSLVETFGESGYEVIATNAEVDKLAEFAGSDEP